MSQLFQELIHIGSINTQLEIAKMDMKLSQIIFPREIKDYVENNWLEILENAISNQGFKIIFEGDKITSQYLPPPSSNNLNPP
jgi:hypothetical protein